MVLRTYDVGNEIVTKCYERFWVLLRVKIRASSLLPIGRLKLAWNKRQESGIKRLQEGTNMHKHLEQHLLGAGHLDLTPEGKIAKAMSGHNNC